MTLLEFLIKHPTWNLRIEHGEHRQQIDIYARCEISPECVLGCSVHISKRAIDCCRDKVVAEHIVAEGLDNLSSQITRAERDQADSRAALLRMRKEIDPGAPDMVVL